MATIAGLCLVLLRILTPAAVSYIIIIIIIKIEEAAPYMRVTKGYTKN